MKKKAKATGGKNLKAMIEQGKIPIKGGVCIDLYNQCVHEDFFTTILCGIDFRCMHYVTELK